VPRVVKAIAVVVLTLSLGLQWALLQSVAWAGMVVRYSQEGSLSSALAKTFDGRHACKLCRIVQAGRSAEKTPVVELKLTKFEACAPVLLTTVLAETTEVILAERDLPILTSRSDAPPLPPPRRA